MIAVIFEVLPYAEHRQAYLDTAANLRPHLEKIDGYISIERFESLSQPGKVFSLGLMPKVIDQCYQALKLLRSEGMAVLLVEQNTERALAAADDVCVLESGATVWCGSAADARKDPNLTAAYLGLH